jgi:hypothetical protein
MKILMRYIENKVLKITELNEIAYIERILLCARPAMARLHFTLWKGEKPRNYCAFTKSVINIEG